MFSTVYKDKEIAKAVNGMVESWVDDHALPVDSARGERDVNAEYYYRGLMAPRFDKRWKKLGYTDSALAPAVTAVSLGEMSMELDDIVARKERGENGIREETSVALLPRRRRGNKQRNTDTRRPVMELSM